MIRLPVCNIIWKRLSSKASALSPTRREQRTGSCPNETSPISFGSGGAAPRGRAAVDAQGPAAEGNRRIQSRTVSGETLFNINAPQKRQPERPGRQRKVSLRYTLQPRAASASAHPSGAGKVPFAESEIYLRVAPLLKLAASVGKVLFSHQCLTVITRATQHPNTANAARPRRPGGALCAK